MPNGLLNLALGLAMQVGSPGPSETPGYPAIANAYGRYGSEGSSEPRYPFDTQQNFVHGYFQEIPAYGGHPVFRPNNYKDVLSQSQTAAGWGERPTMPYSQQFWHKYHDQATMLKMSYNVSPYGSPYGSPYTQPAWAQQYRPQGQYVAPSPHGAYVATPNTQMYVPQYVQPVSNGPIQMPIQNQAPAGYSYPENRQIEVVNPATYRSYNSVPGRE